MKSFSNHQNAIEHLAKTYEQIRDEYITTLHEMIFQYVLNRNFDRDINNCSNEILNQADDKIQNIIRQATSLEEQCKWKYIQCLGSKIGKASKGIILQYFSKDLNFAPSTLKTFEQKLQVIALQQCSQFIEQLTQLPQDENTTYKFIKNSLKLDIDVFKKISSSPYYELSKQLGFHYTKKPFA